MTNLQTKPSFGRRLWWIIRTTFVSLLLIVILGGIGWAAYYGTSELQRSFNSLGERIEANKQRIELLNDDVIQMKAEDAAGSVAALQATVADLEGQLAALEAEGMAELSRSMTELDRQAEMLATLEADVAAAATSAETAALGDAILALQNDINDSNGRLDSLGGEIDDVRAEAEQAAAAAISETELDSMRQTVALFQLWEHIARARLHLAEDNVGLASTEVAQTLRLVDLLLAASADEDVAALELMQTRLSLAFDSLPDDPETAVLDLENAWSQLDAFLMARLYPNVDVPAVLGETAVDEAAPAEGEEAAATEEATPTPEATPAATPTPTATPTATPSS